MAWLAFCLGCGIIADMASPESASGSGRPRDPDKAAAILEAAVSLLTEVGYESIRMQDIASRAHVGLGAIYRRWKSKDDVIIGAYAALPVPSLVETDQPEADLHVFIAALARHYVTYIHALPSLLNAQQHSAVIQRATSEHVKHNVIHPLTEAAERAGLTADQSRHLADIVPALLTHRLSIMSEEVNPIHFADEVLGLVKPHTSETNS